MTLSLRSLQGLRPDLCREARAYFLAARHFMDPAPPQLVAIGGFSGTGKSTLAASLAPGLGICPGALHLRSDIERKHLFQVAETVRLPKGSYAPDIVGPVYHRLHDLVALGLQAGRSVIVDATYRSADQRHAIEGVARRLGLPFTGIWLDAPLATLTKRVAARRGDASDADAEVVLQQISSGAGGVAWHHIDASGEAQATAERAARLLEISLVPPTVLMRSEGALGIMKVREGAERASPEEMA